MEQHVQKLDGKKAYTFENHEHLLGRDDTEYVCVSKEEINAKRLEASHKYFPVWTCSTASFNGPEDHQHFLRGGTSGRTDSPGYGLVHIDDYKKVWPERCDPLDSPVEGVPLRDLVAAYERARLTERAPSMSEKQLEAAKAEWSRQWAKDLRQLVQASDEERHRKQKYQVVCDPQELD